MSDAMINETKRDVEESIVSGYSKFGYLLECNVPYQLPTDDNELEYQIEDYYKTVKSLKPASYDKQERSYGREYKKSVTLSKLKRLHRWGYYMAKGTVPDNFTNKETLCEFIIFWDNFTKNNDAEELTSIFSGVVIDLTLNDNEISWEATLIGKDGFEDHQIENAECVRLTDEE